jgi:hypothetical protein
MPTTFRPTFGRVLSIGVWLVCLLTIVLSIRSGMALVLGLLPWMLLASGAAWMVFWNPRVVVDDGGVHLVNLLRTIDVPWPAIQNVDTKWALTLTTAYGTFTAWAAPAPGGLSTARRISRTDRDAIPASAKDEYGAVRPGDLPDSPSGSAATVVRRRWEELRDAGWLDDPQLEHEAVPVRWHWLTIAIGAALLVACAVTALV